MKEENNKKEERESEKIQSHYNVRPEFGGERSIQAAPAIQ